MEAQALNCRSCGAPVGPQDLQCPYCHSQLATVACPGCLGMVPVNARHCPQCGRAMGPEAAPGSGPASLACPGCGKGLAASRVGGVPLDQCLACGGVWVDQKAFEGLAAHREDRGQVLGSLPGGERLAVPVAAVRYRPCPVCQKFMNRMNYARISGVVLDVCKDHGLWFDRDELRQVLAFIEGGGLERSRARQMADLEEKRRLAALPPPPSGGGGWMEDVPLAGPGNRGFESLLGGLLSALLKF